MEDSKICFLCRKPKKLTDYSHTYMKYTVKGQKARATCCLKCCEKRALNTLQIMQFDFNINKHYYIDFKNKKEVREYFKKEAGQAALPPNREIYIQQNQSSCSS